MRHCPMSSRSSRPASRLQTLVWSLASAMVLAVGLGAAPSSATVVVLHSLERMTATAELIVQVRVHDSRTLREQGRTITLTEVEVVEGLKGAKAGDVLTIYQVGGIHDGQRTQVIGSYEYEDGEEFLLFAVRHGDRVVSYGVGVGKYEIARSPAGIDVVPAYGDVAVMTPRAGGKDTVGNPPAAVPQPLAVFKTQIRQHLRAPVRMHPRGAKPHTAEMLRKTKLKARRLPTGEGQ